MRFKETLEKFASMLNPQPEEKKKNYDLKAELDNLAREKENSAILQQRRLQESVELEKAAAAEIEASINERFRPLLETIAQSEFLNGYVSKITYGEKRMGSKDSSPVVPTLSLEWSTWNSRTGITNIIVLGLDRKNSKVYLRAGGNSSERQIHSPQFKEDFNIDKKKSWIDQVEKALVEIMKNDFSKVS